MSIYVRDASSGLLPGYVGEFGAGALAPRAPLTDAMKGFAPFVAHSQRSTSALAASGISVLNDFRTKSEFNILNSVL